MDPATSAIIGGVAGAITTGILGPALLHYLQGDRAGKNDRRDVLDAAAEPMARAAARAQALNRVAGKTPEGFDWDSELREYTSLTYEVRAHALRIQFRFGEGKIASSYMAAAKALNELGQVHAKAKRGQYKLHADVIADLDAAGARYGAAFEEFARAAHRWYEDAHPSSI